MTEKKKRAQRPKVADVAFKRPGDRLAPAQQDAPAAKQASAGRAAHATGGRAARMTGRDLFSRTVQQIVYMNPAAHAMLKKLAADETLKRGETVKPHDLCLAAFNLLFESYGLPQIARAPEPEEND